MSRKDERLEWFVATPDTWRAAMNKSIRVLTLFGQDGFVGTRRQAWQMFESVWGPDGWALGIYVEETNPDTGEVGGVYEIVFDGEEASK